MTDNAFQSWISKSVPRVEDGRLLRGSGRFLDDIKIDRMLLAAFVRSPVAHAILKKVNLDAARALPGVHAVFAYDDLRPLMMHDRIPLALPSGAIRFEVDPPALVHEEICYVGEPIAVVIADTRAIAEDAAALVELEFDSLPVVL